MVAKSDVPTSCCRHLHATKFCCFAEGSITSDDINFILMSKGRNSAIDMLIVFQNEVRKDYIFQ